MIKTRNNFSFVYNCVHHTDAVPEYTLGQAEVDNCERGAIKFGRTVNPSVLTLCASEQCTLTNTLRMVASTRMAAVHHKKGYLHVD